MLETKSLHFRTRYLHFEGRFWRRTSEKRKGKKGGSGKRRSTKSRQTLARNKTLLVQGQQKYGGGQSSYPPPLSVEIINTFYSFLKEAFKNKKHMELIDIDTKVCIRVYNLILNSPNTEHSHMIKQNWPTLHYGIWPHYMENLQLFFTSLKWYLGNSKAFLFLPLKRPKILRKIASKVWWGGGGHKGKK